MNESRTDKFGNYIATFCVLISVILYVVTDVPKKCACSML